MKVIRKLPGKPAEGYEVANELKALQEEVGGLIETVTIARDACVICNEEGRLIGLPYNCDLFGVNFVGPILVVGIDGGEFTDLPERDWILERLGV